MTDTPESVFVHMANEYSNSNLYHKLSQANDLLQIFPRQVGKGFDEYK